MLIEVTNVPDAALPVAAFKAHLHMGSGFDEDDAQDVILRGFLRAAMAAVEARTSKALISRDFGWRITDWSSPAAQDLPVAPVSEVTRVSLVGPDGNESDVNAAVYWLERDGHQPRLRPTAACLPTVPKRYEILVEFVAGFGPTWDDLPSDLQQAVFMLATHFYEYRHDTALSDGCMPFGVTSLIERFRPLRLGRMGGAR